MKIKCKYKISKDYVMNKKIQIKRGVLCEPYYGWLLYASAQDGPDPDYAKLYYDACRKYGMEAELVFFDPNKLDVPDGRKQIAAWMKTKKPQYIINRTRDYRIAQMFEAAGIQVFNHSFVAAIGNDKAWAYRYMKQKGIPFLPAVFDVQKDPEWYPAVVKSCRGHGGTQVYLIQNKVQWQEWKQHSFKREEDYVVQQAASDCGKDVRVYIVGGQIAAAVLRTSAHDFRSNYCLGGAVSLYSLSEKERALVKRAAAGLSIGMAGIDFIFHHGEMMFNEIEDVAGARGLYTLTDYNIVEAYVEYIQKEISHGRKVW